MTKVLLYSGGVDSTCLSLLWKPDVALYVRHPGYPYGEKEFKGLLPPINGELKVYTTDDHPGLRVPTRNAFYLAFASLYGDVLASAILSNEVPMMPKRTTDDMAAVLNGLWFGAREPRSFVVELPAKDFTKTQLVAEFLKAGGDPERLKKASSCFDPVQWECGVCRGCKERKEAFEANGIGA